MLRFFCQPHYLTGALEQEMTETNRLIESRKLATALKTPCQLK